jgi:uncharacterized membrane protein (DUF373 family)
MPTLSTGPAGEPRGAPADLAKAPPDLAPPTDPPVAADPAATPGGPVSRRHSIRSVEGSIWALEHAQDIVTVIVGIVLIALAGVLLISGIYDFAHSVSAKAPILDEATFLLDRVLLVLILVEIVHTVALSLRAHRLIAQPFIVVGLVAVIRRILFVLTPSSTGQARISTSQLALLLAMVAVFIAGLIAVSRFEKRQE